MGGILEEIGMLGRGLMRGSKSGNVPRLLAREAESGLATRFAPPPATAPMAAPVAPSGIRVYHGSPHSFDKFDMSKVGTGEGAQAYGHGLYFADKEGIAKSYRDKLAKGTTLKLDNDAFDSAENSPTGLASSFVKGYGDIPTARQGMVDQIKAYDNGTMPDSLRQAWAGNEAGLQKYMDNLRSGVDFLDKYKDRLKVQSDEGHMYEVNIKADPEHFLDWDKPLKDQPKLMEFAQSKGISEPPMQWHFNGYAGGYTRKTVDGSIQIANVTNTAPGKYVAKFKKQELGEFPNVDSAKAAIDRAIAQSGATPDDVGRYSGQDFYSKLAGGNPSGLSHVDTSGASRELQKAGIPGIKYLDAGSRVSKFDPWLDIYRAGDGPGVYITKEKGGGYFKGYDDAVEELKKRFSQSLNYVVFDDSIIEIVKKYGIAGALGAGLITQEMADQMRAQGVPDAVSHKTTPAGPSAMPTRERFGG